MDTLAQLAKAAQRGMESAGFVNVRTDVQNEGQRVLLYARGDCPCGIGQSGVGMAFTKEMLAHNTVDMTVMVEHRIHAESMKHIDQDRAEGRWV